MVEWWETESEAIAQEKKQRMEELGYKEPLRLEKGETRIELDLGKAPEKITTQYGEKYIYSLKSHPDNTLFASQMMHRLLIAHLNATGNARASILKTGEGKETRYEVLNK